MFPKRIVCLLAALCCTMGLCAAAGAAEVDCDDTYCFSAGDFSQEEEAQLTGICITELPDPMTGTAMLGSRVLRSGDILTAEQVAQMTFVPLRTEEDQVAVVTFLPIYENRVAPSTTMTLAIRGKKDEIPVAEDSALETYKNLPNEGVLKVSDPEGKSLTYSVTRQPKRGEVVIREDGSFLYTPKKNKVGVDSFVYTATDPAGNVSRQATVTVTILKPSNSAQYTDTVGSDCRFAAEWMKNTGLFVGEKVGGEFCFNEDKTVTRGEFLTMLIQTLDIPVSQESTFVGYTDTMPKWLQPYVAAALRAGLTAGLPSSETGIFGHGEAVTGGEVAVMLQNAMDLAVSTSSMEEVNTEEPGWAMAAVSAMNENGIAITASQVMTRGEVAVLLYQISQMAESNAGLAMYQ